MLTGRVRVHDPRLSSEYTRNDDSNRFLVVVAVVAVGSFLVRHILNLTIPGYTNHVEIDYLAHLPNLSIVRMGLVGDCASRP